MNIIKTLREEREMTQTDLANALGYSRTMVTKWETGSLEPTHGQKIDICKVLDVPIEYLEVKEEIKSIKTEFHKTISYSNKVLMSASFEDGIYLLICLILIIINNYYSIPHFWLASTILLAIGLIGALIIPILFMRNIRKLKDDNQMKYWYIKKKTSKIYLKKIKSENTVDSEFRKLILNHSSKKG